MKIVFFDGVCNLCNQSVDYMINQPELNEFMFSSIQGETAKKYLTPEEIADLNSVVVIDGADKYKRSSAAIHILGKIHYLYKIFWLVPSFLRDPMYNLVAKYRYKFWGERDSCRLPQEHEKERFLD